MTRKRVKREFSFKPKYKYFLPKEGSAESLKLLHEEIEAIYLMDHQDLYQEEAAERMGISRPTFSRIIKNARMKVATALINGKGLIIEDEKEEFKVAFVCDNKENFGVLSLEAPFLVIVELHNDIIKNIKVLENPVHSTKERPGAVLPPLLYDENINYFLTDKAGEGLKNSLLTKGIFIIKKESIKKEELEKLSSNL